MQELSTRFLGKIEPVTESGCWLWLGSLDHKGYGKFFTGERVMRLAHRVSWRLFRGDIPEGLLVCHHCDVKCCVNPYHLFIGTSKDNTQDARKKMRFPGQRLTHCKNGHEFTPQNTIRYASRPGERKCRICHNANTRRARRLTSSKDVAK